MTEHPKACLSNPPAQTPEHVTHRTFHSELVDCEVGYNIYLPPDYADSGARYPVVYHLHGYRGNESTDIWPLEKRYRGRAAITVFANGTASNGYLDRELPIESIILTELIPHIDAQYRAQATRAGRAISGFSMGGAGAFYYAVKHPEIFGAVTAYAGTYHHFYHKGSRTVGVAPEKAAEIYESMMREERYLEEDNILYLVRRNAERIRGDLQIELHVGSNDILFCDNEILHLYLNALNIPHVYRIFDGAGHELGKIL